jgi:hypothetical protein
MANSSKNYPILLTAGLLFIALAVFILFDLTAAVSVYLPVVVGYSILWLIVTAVLLRRQSRSAQLLVLGLFLAGMAVVSALNWDSRKPFLRDLYRIEPGMTVAQVDQIMAGYLRTPASPGQVNQDNGITYRHTIAGWGDSDWGVVAFQNNRVSHVEFLPD